MAFVTVICKQALRVVLLDILCDCIFLLYHYKNSSQGILICESRQALMGSEFEFEMTTIDELYARITQDVPANSGF